MWDWDNPLIYPNIVIIIIIIFTILDTSIILSYSNMGG